MFCKKKNITANFYKKSKPYLPARPLPGNLFFMPLFL